MSYQEIMDEYYPIYKQICIETLEKPCELGFICWLETNGININGTKTTKPDTEQTLTVLNFVEQERASDISSKGWETKKQQEQQMVTLQ